MVRCAPRSSGMLAECCCGGCGFKSRHREISFPGAVTQTARPKKRKQTCGLRNLCLTSKGRTNLLALHRPMESKHTAESARSVNRRREAHPLRSAGVPRWAVVRLASGSDAACDYGRTVTGPPLYARCLFCRQRACMRGSYKRQRTTTVCDNNNALLTLGIGNDHTSRNAV